MKNLLPDILAQIYLYDAIDSPEKRKKGKKILAVQYSCPLFFAEEAFDARLFLNQIAQSISAGETLYRVPIKFLSRKNAESYLKVGEKFRLWEMGFIGEGEIVKVIQHTQS